MHFIPKKHAEFLKRVIFILEKGTFLAVPEPFSHFANSLPICQVCAGCPLNHNENDEVFIQKFLGRARQAMTKGRGGIEQDNWRF